MNGRFTSGNSTARDTPVVLASSMQMPVTPPSMKLLDSRNPFSPMPADRIPSAMSAAFNNSGSNRRMTTYSSGVVTSHLCRIALALVLATAGLAAGDDWPQFRGPTGQGLSSERGLPLEWSETRNVVWKTPVPGLGWSSPVVAGRGVWGGAGGEERGGGRGAPAVGGCARGGGGEGPGVRGPKPRLVHSHK